MKNLFFWSNKEINYIKKNINKFASVTAFAEDAYANGNINRNIHSIVQKVAGLTKSGEITYNRPPSAASIAKAERIKRKELKATARAERKERSLALPQGFSFDFTPKKAQMYKDHVRLYF